MISRQLSPQLLPLRSLVRTYATRPAPGPRLGKTLSLDHVRPFFSRAVSSPACRIFLQLDLSLLTKWTNMQFLQRSRALSLYRTIIRGTRRISDAATRAETRRFARDEFERHRNVEDIVCALNLREWIICGQNTPQRDKMSED